MIKILHTSDIDLGATPTFTNQFNEKHHCHRLETFNAIIDLAIARQVDLFVVLGNLFTVVNPAAQWLETVHNGLIRLEEHGIKVVLYRGHRDVVIDIDDFDHYYPDKNDSHCVQVMVGDERVDLHLLNLSVLDAKEQINVPSATYHVGLLRVDSDPQCSNPYYDYLIHHKESIQRLGCDYVAVGNRNPSELGDGNIIAFCPGSPQAIDFAEKGPRFCALVTLDQQGVVVDPIQIQQSLFDRVCLDISDFFDDKQICAAVIALAQENLVLQVELVGEIEYPLALHRIANQCQNSFTYLDLVDHTSLLNSSYLKAMAKENTVRGKLAKSFIAKSQNTADPDQLRIFELALRDLLFRFNAVQGENDGAVS